MNNNYKYVFFLLVLMNYGCLGERVFKISETFSIYDSESCDCICLGRSNGSDYQILLHDVKRIRGNKSKFIVHVEDGDEKLSYLIDTSTGPFNKGDEIQLNPSDLKAFFRTAAIDFDKAF